MKKRVLSLFLVLCTVASLIAAVPVSVSAYGGTAYGNGLYYKISNGEAAITDCDRSVTTIEIPSSINGYPVTGIGGGTFGDCSNLTNITIPNSVTSIGESAFQRCSSLTSITIPNGVTNIGNYTFGRCSSLTDITIPNSVTSIGSSAFYECSSLTSITIPNSVTSIGEYAFSGCSNLTSITIPNNVTSIDYGAFEDCSSLTNIIIQNGVKYIDHNVFRKCTSLTSIVIPNSVTGIESYAFDECTSLTSIAIPKSVTIIAWCAFYSCKSLKDVYYGGSEEEWKKISIGSDNYYLTNATIHYNSKMPGETEEPDDTPEINMPAEINNVTINYKGSAYGYFLVTDSNGKELKNKTVSYTVDGGSAKSAVTDDYGYLCVEIKNITKNHDYTVNISEDGVQSAVGVLSVTVKPLKFTSTYEAVLTRGASAALGFGVGGSIGYLGADAKAAEIGIKGTNKKGLSVSQEMNDGKTKLTVLAKENNDAAINAKAGLWAETKKRNKYIDVGEVHGSASYGNTISVGFEDEDFDIKDSVDRNRLVKFMTLVMLENMDSNVAIRWLIEQIPFESDTYESGSTAAIAAGASIGSIKLKKGNEEYGGVRIGGIDANAIWSRSEKELKDKSVSRKSGVAADFGFSLAKISLFKKEGDNKVSSKTSAWGKKLINDKVEFSAENDKNGKLTSLGITMTDDSNNDILLYKSSTSKSRMISYSGEAAEKVADSYSELKDFSLGNKAFFSLGQMSKAANAITNSDQKGSFSATTAKKKGVDLNISASVQLFLELGGELGVSGTESYSYETENGIFKNNVVYTQAKNDIDKAVEDNFFSVKDMFSDIKDYMGNLISQYWETVSGWMGNTIGTVVDVGKAAVKGTKKTVKKWKVSITKAIEDIKPFSVMAVDSEIALFSTSSVATTVGNPYIISVEDEDGNEITDMSESPVMLELKYTDEELAQAGVYDASELTIFRWNEDKCVYVNMGGTLNEAEKLLSLEITKPGQYILAVDNCPPAVTEFTALNSGDSAEISAIVSDMSGIADFEMKLDGKTVVDNSNFDDYYEHTTGKFSYTATGLENGVHSAVIYASDTSGNALTDGVKIEFSIAANMPVISNVTELAEYVSGELEVSAEVSGEDISAVYLNVEEIDAVGERARFAYEMAEENGVYSAKTDKLDEGAMLNVWVSAYTSDGSGVKSDVKSVLAASDKPLIVITKADKDSVTVRTVNCGNANGEKIILGVYDQDGALKNALTEDVKEEVTFSGIDFTGKVKVMLWDAHMKPLSKAKECTVAKPEVEITEFSAAKSGEINISVANAPADATVYAAAYDKKGRLLEVQRLQLTQGKAAAVFAAENVFKYKAFVWDGKLKPLTEMREWIR